MASLKNFFAVTFGIMGALILAPFVAFFGLFMMGLAFGLSLIAAGAVTTMAHKAKQAHADAVDAEPVKDDAAGQAAEAQPA